VYQQQQQEEQQQQQDAENPFLDPTFSRIKTHSTVKRTSKLHIQNASVIGPLPEFSIAASAIF
jgi:hypothetical protein